jgi:hypothetical protein
MISFIVPSVLMIVILVIITSFYSIKIDKQLKITTILKTQTINEFVPLYLSILFLALVSVIVSTINNLEYLIIFNFFVIQFFGLVNDDRKPQMFEFELQKTFSVVIAYIIVNRENTESIIQVTTAILILPIFISMDKNKIIENISTNIFDLSLIIYFSNKIYVVSSFIEAMCLTVVVCVLYCLLKIIWKELFQHIKTRIYWSSAMFGLGLLNYVA